MDSPYRHWAKEWGKNKQRAEDKQPEAGNPSEWGGTTSIIFMTTWAKFQALLPRGALGCLVFRKEADSWAWAPNKGEERPGGEGHRDQGEQLATTWRLQKEGCRAPKAFLLPSNCQRLLDHAGMCPEGRTAEQG